MPTAWALKGLAALWRIVNTPLGRRIAAIAAAVLATWLLLALVDHRGFERGVAHEQAAQAKRLAHDRALAARVSAKAQAGADQVGARLDRRQVEIRTVTRTIVEKVPIYVTVQADRRCDVPAGFVQLHDAAAAGRLPDPADAAGGAADAASGLALSTVAATVADNYGTCLGVAAQLKGWQDFWATTTRILSAPP
jgi:hypothetical protein